MKTNKTRLLLSGSLIAALLAPQPALSATQPGEVCSTTPTTTAPPVITTTPTVSYMTSVTTTEHFEPGSLIIPMDDCYQWNSTTVGTGHSAPQCVCGNTTSDNGVIRAYGLVYRLLQNGVPIYMMIDDTKTVIDGIDFSIATGGEPVKKLNPATGTQSSFFTSACAAASNGTYKIDYRSAPFVIAAIDAPRALQLMQGGSIASPGAFTTATFFPMVDIHVAQVGFNAKVSRRFEGAPKPLALLDIGGADGVNSLKGYLDDAGIIGATRGDTSTECAPGEVFGIFDAYTDFTNGNCLNTAGYTTLWLPHWVAGNTGTPAIMQSVINNISSFLDTKHAVFAQCASVETLEGSYNMGNNNGGLQSCNPAKCPLADVGYGAHYQLNNGVVKNYFSGYGSAATDKFVYRGLGSPFIQKGNLVMAVQGVTSHVQHWRPANCTLCTQSASQGITDTSGGSGPSFYKSDVTRFISTCSGTDLTAAGNCKWDGSTPDSSFTAQQSLWDFFTFRRKDGDIKKGPILYLAGHDYTGNNNPGGERLILNTMISLEAEIKPPLVVTQNLFGVGPVARDGVVYVAKNSNPGKFLALNDQNPSQVYWDAGNLLDFGPIGDAQRNIYTVSACTTPTGTTAATNGTNCGIGNRLNFTTANAGNTLLQQTLQLNSSTSATTTIAWARSARFGTASAPAKLGPIENSTAGLLTPPRPPYWYNFGATTGAERALIDTYVNNNANRAKRIFVGSRDGMLHAFDENGLERWAFIPHDVAGRLDSDRQTNVSTAFPDGPPVLVNAKLSAGPYVGQWRTVLIAGEANGGRSVFALDVTEVDNPIPLWYFSDVNMGRTFSKPTVARVKDLGLTERYLAIFSSGAGTNSDQGDSVYAVDLTTGALVWKFSLGDSNVYISTDITATETKDSGESGAPVIDGYIDRVYFADNKGRVWKLNPAQHTGTAIAPVNSNVATGLAYPALFSTASTSGALGVARPISGGIASTIDSDGRAVIYFGTGGSPDSPAGVINEFYAVYAETGVIKAKKTGQLGEMFGGAAVSDGDQLVIISRFPTDLTNLCGDQTSRITTVSINNLATQNSLTVSGQLTGAPYIDNGELYVSTTTGGVLATAFLGSAGVGTNSGYSAAGVSGIPMTIMSWRQY